MTFLNSLKKWFYTNNSSAAGSAARIPLLDASGNAVGSDTYNAISEIVRQELGKILNGGTDQTTGITKVPSLVGTALGATTVGNLASVLGGLIINKTAIAGSDANNFETGTGYRLSGGINVAHKPSSPNRMVIYTYANDSLPSYSKFQIALIADGSIAAREYDTEGWEDWSKTPSYLNAYPNLSSLASALGVSLHIKTSEAVINPNSTYSFAMVNGTNFISCDGSWGIYGTRYNKLTTVAQAAVEDMRFSVSIEQNTVTITNTHTSAIECVIVQIGLLL